MQDTLRKCIFMRLPLTTYKRMTYMVSAWQKSKDNGRSGRHFFATGTVPNHWTRHGDGRHMADKGHPRNHEGRRPCSTGRRLFSVLAIFEAKLTADLVSELAMGPSEASKVARCAGADWHAPDDWKRKVVEAIERSANVSRVFLLVARVDEGWVTIPSYGNKNGSPRFEPMSKYEKWLARPLAVLPASDLLSFVYEKCEQIRRGSDNPRSRKKP
jgi:hypothetical protein